MRGSIYLLYIIIGLLLGTINSGAMVMCFTVLPIQTYFLIHHYKKRHFVLTCFFGFLYLSMGLSPVFFFLNSADAEQWGFSAIGYYDFALLGYFKAYFKVLFFLIIVHLLSFRIEKNRIDFFNYVNKTFLKFTQFKTSYSYNILLVLAVIAFGALSIWMFNHSIGVTGIKTKQLPYHLSGILFYLRNYTFWFLLFFIYLKSRNKTLAFIFIALYAVIAGFSASSKGQAILTLAPVIYESFVTKHRLRAFFGITLAVLLFATVSFGRELVFMFDQVDENIFTVVSYSLDSLSRMEVSWVSQLLGAFTGRLYGANTIVLADQYHITTFSDIIQFYMGASIEQIIPDYSHTIFGVVLPEDMAYGVGIGYLGTMMLLSSGNYLYIILQAIFIGSLFNVVERILNYNVKYYSSFLVHAVSILFAAFFVLRLIEASGMLMLYFIIVLMYILPYFIKRIKLPRRLSFV